MFKQIHKNLSKLLSSFNFFQILAIFLVVLGLFFLAQKTRSKEEWIKATVKISSPSWWNSSLNAPPYWLGETIRPGDKEYDSQGKMLAEVINAKTYELNTLQLQEATKKDTYLYLNLNVNKNKKLGRITFKNKLLEVGGPVELHLNSTMINGLVVYIEGKSAGGEEKEVLVEGVWPYAYPWSAEAIHVGQKTEDETGDPGAEIIEKRVELAAKTVETASGGLVVSLDPLRRDIYLKIKLKVIQSGENLYYLYDKKVKIGEQLFIQFPGADVKWFNVTGVFTLDGQKIY